jgi:hypothetical protein
LLVKPGNIEEKWSHDLYDSDYEEKSNHSKKQFQNNKPKYQNYDSKRISSSQNRDEPQIQNKNTEILKTEKLVAFFFFYFFSKNLLFSY